MTRMRNSGITINDVSQIQLTDGDFESAMVSCSGRYLSIENCYSTRGKYNIHAHHEEEEIVTSNVLSFAWISLIYVHICVIEWIRAESSPWRGIADISCRLEWHRRHGRREVGMFTLLDQMLHPNTLIINFWIRISFTHTLSDRQSLWSLFII